MQLEGERTGSGVPVVLLHGLSATRRYVLMGSRHLTRAGAELVAYDARGHGASGPAPSREAYEYADMVLDLETVLASVGSPVVLAGNSMGAATAAAYALEHPERVSALVQVTPGFSGAGRDDQEMGNWEALADGLESDGVDGFMQAFEPPREPRFREAALKFTRQRIERHEHPEAVADALRVVPRSAAFEGLDSLRSLEMPTLVVGSRDESDPGHPLSLAKAYAEHLPNSQFLVEREGESPLAWQGAQLSRAIESFLREAQLL
ncbi:MAG TPA: alpha/beta fold hydrolase [Thermoleophilaceae bacterium]|nr:alpha/beta fold hydrolase [Thermoleophilaceae bacterium]